MDEIIQIEEKEIRLLRKKDSAGLTVERRVGLESFLETLRLKLPPPARDFPILPPGTRWFGRDEHTTVLVLEEGPRRRRIKVNLAGEGETPDFRFFHLAFPYILYVIIFRQGSFEEMKIFYRPSPLEGLDDKLFFSNLLNVQATAGRRSENRACLRPKPDLGGKDLSSAAPALIDHFWSTDFNRDIEENCFDRARRRDPRLEDLKVWEDASTADPFFPLRIPWEILEDSLGDLIQHMLAAGSPGKRKLEDAGDLADLLFRSESSDYYRYDVDDESVYPI